MNIQDLFNQNDPNAGAESLESSFGMGQNASNITNSFLTKQDKDDLGQVNGLMKLTGITGSSTPPPTDPTKMSATVTSPADSGDSEGGNAASDALGQTADASTAVDVEEALNPTAAIIGAFL